MQPDLLIADRGGAWALDVSGRGDIPGVTARRALVGRDGLLEQVVLGPHTDTGRILDLSPQVLRDLGLQTDETALVAFAAAGTPLGVVRPSTSTSPPPPEAPPVDVCPSGAVCPAGLPLLHSGNTAA